MGAKDPREPSAAAQRVAMWFRLRVTVRELSLRSTGVEPLVLRMHRTHDLTLTITSQGSEPNTAACMVETEFKVKPAHIAVFDALAANRLPPGHLPREQWRPAAARSNIDDAGNIKEGYVVPMALMPKGFLGFADALYVELNGAADAALGVLRWRTRTLGTRRPFSFRSWEWSDDGAAWHQFPSILGMRALDYPQLHLAEATAAEIQGLLDEGEREPLAHLLLREAWGQRYENPRSSLLIGVTALEVGVKQYIGACVPHAAWLAEHVPSPPVVTMLQEYLPKLPPPSGGTVLQRQNDEVVEVLKTAISKRNDLTHRGEDVEVAQALRSLRAIRNVLWLLDEAGGQAWARAHLFPSLDQDFPAGYRKA